MFHNVGALCDSLKLVSVCFRLQSRASLECVLPGFNSQADVASQLHRSFLTEHVSVAVICSGLWFVIRCVALEIRSPLDCAGDAGGCRAALCD